MFIRTGFRKTFERRYLNCPEKLNRGSGRRPLPAEGWARGRAGLTFEQVRGREEVARYRSSVEAKEGAD